MSYRQTPSSFFPRKILPLGLQPALAWTAILGFILLSALGILAGQGKILNLAFPAGALAVGVLLYFRYPILYIGFTWWMWFLTPLIRRLADYQSSSFTDPSPILLAPLLVTLVTLVTLYQHLPKTHRQGGLSFILSFAGIFYGLLIGLIHNKPPIALGIDFLRWFTPILFGFHLFVNWQNYPSSRYNIQRTFFWGVLVMGVYGVIQFLVAPEWDKFWLIQADFSNAGRPEPLAINVFSTLNSPRTFCSVMMASLLLLLVNENKGALDVPATVAGYLSFLLGGKRTTWGGWFLGVLVMSTSLKEKHQIRLIVTMMVMALCLVPLTTLEPFSEDIHSRFETFSNLEENGSANIRMAIYRAHLDSALTSFVGEGIGPLSVGTTDSGILTALLGLGWLGTLFYLSGILPLLVGLFQDSESRSDPFASAARAIALATFAQLPLGNPLVDAQGLILWSFLSIGMAGKKYYHHQRTLEIRRTLQ